MASTKSWPLYVGALVLVGIAGFYANKVSKKMDERTDEDELIRQYLLTDSPLYGYNRPKIWIHTKYEINARKWKDFYSRNSTDLNQPYIHLTIKTIIDHCGADFNVCLIDDQSFSKLIPSWDVDLTTVAEPMRSHFRELGLLQLVYFYGGMVVPNSFVCLKNLAGFYADSTAAGSRPFVCENINRNVNLVKQKHKMLFVPDLYFYGAPKNDPTIKDLVEYLKVRNRFPHFSSETDLLGDTSEWCFDAIKNQRMGLVGGEMTGVKTEDRKAIMVEDLMEEGFLNLRKDLVGIYIPDEEILNRPKYQWFAVLPIEQLLGSNLIIAKYLKASIVETTDEYYKKTGTIKSIAAI
jgi:hypothetical protein